MPSISQRRANLKRLVIAIAAVLVAAGLALAVVTRPSAAHPPTTASLMPAYVEAAQYWQTHATVFTRAKSSAAAAHPPTTASLMPAYVEGAKYWRAYATFFSRMMSSAASVQAARLWRR
jgi:hypothetical protein